MQYIKLAKDMNVSRICFGGEQLGGYALGDYDVNDTVRTALTAYDKGINFYDTADCYGLGQSENNLSRVIKEVGRENIIVSTKFGVRLDEQGKVFYDNSRNWLLNALQASLKRLSTDYIDLYQVHYWDGITDLRDIFCELEKLCNNGLIRYYGVTNIKSIVNFFDLQEFPHLISFSDELSLAKLDNLKYIKILIDRGLRFLAYGVLGQGILTGKYSKEIKLMNNDRRKNSKYVNFHGEKLNKNLNLLDQLEFALKEHINKSLAQIAINWVLNSLKDSVVIAGIKNRKQLDDNINALKWRLNQSELCKIKNIINK